MFYGTIFEKETRGLLRDSLTCSSFNTTVWLPRVSNVTISTSSDIYVQPASLCGLVVSLYFTLFHHLRKPSSRCKSGSFVIWQSGWCTIVDSTFSYRILSGMLAAYPSLEVGAHGINYKGCMVYNLLWENRYVSSLSALRSSPHSNRRKVEATLNITAPIPLVHQLSIYR